MAHVINIDDTDGVNYFKRNLRNNIYEKFGVKTARTYNEISIHFRKGASHVSWKDKSRNPAWLVAVWNMKGGAKSSARPLFKDYMAQNGEWVHDVITNKIEHSRTIYDGLVSAAYIIKIDVIKWVENGGLDAYPNRGKYREQKLSHFGHDTPFFATGQLLNDLEVTVNGITV